MGGDKDANSGTTPRNPAEGAAVRAVPPAPETNQLPGFRVVNEAPRRGGSKLVWTAIVVIIVVLAGYIFGYFR